MGQRPPDARRQQRPGSTRMTTDELYLITGATGKTGAHTVKLLRERGRRVRALVHGHDDRSARLSDLGAEVGTADLVDFGAVSSAISGVSGGYFSFHIDPCG